MPLGSSSAAPVIRPGPSLDRSERFPDAAMFGVFFIALRGRVEAASCLCGLPLSGKRLGEVVSELNDALNRTTRDAQLHDVIVSRGATVVHGIPDDFRKFVAAEVASWSPIVKRAGVVVEWLRGRPMKVSTGAILGRAPSSRVKRAQCISLPTCSSSAPGAPACTPPSPLRAPERPSFWSTGA